MVTYVRSLVAVLALGMSVPNAFAQQAPHACGAGPGPNEIIAGVQPAGPGIAPTPLCYWKSGAAQESAPSARWAERWGAIATDAPNGKLGAAVDMSSRRKAERAALESCRKNGGTNCVLERAYANQCTVLVTGDRLYNSSISPTIEAATQHALSVCRRGDVNCRSIYSGCSLPVQIE